MVLMIGMTEVDLNRVDLNLLVALDVLLEERHITNSANRLNLSQPAMSRTLARLRDTFDDPLLIRVPNGYERTAHAEVLAESLKETLRQIRQTFTKPTFDPATATGVFTIAAFDYADMLVMPKFVNVMRRTAPLVRIDTVRRSVLSLEEVLNGTSDISIGIAPKSAPKHVAHEPLFKDRYVCVMDKNHPLASEKLTLEAYLEYPHSIIHGGLTPGSIVDGVLSKMGCQRFVARRSPNFLAAVFSIRDTDLLHAVPQRLVAPMLKPAGLIMHELPFSMKPFQVEQMWHTRNCHNHSHKWFRDQLAMVAQSMPNLESL